ncbi:AAA-ATPase-like domain-containing protein [Mycena indigotica]|uniref:AAA-ATPase-like domain-containing protein n=1 Tax=Mycena indigotica TaxID=2126181 RepID=A0A8H6VZA8_9AGAR|nr:AAA-ATPase-like domain-containing protein [Mycena indigotica]KAF7293619.1 AAA-ATPase-like domain-containing protein [Mycena indigotica]
MDDHISIILNQPFSVQEVPHAGKVFDNIKSSSSGTYDGSGYVPSSQDSPIGPQQVPDSNCLTHICGTVYTRGATCQRLPNPHEDFDDVVNTKGVPLVFKRHVLTQLARLLSSHHALVFRRPPGWGIDFFASMVSATFDRDYDHQDDPFEVLIGEQGLTSGRDDGHHCFFVLDMDFRDLPDEADIRTNLHTYLEKECGEFISRYRLEKRMAPPSLYKVSKDEPERFIILLAMCLLRVSRAPLLVIIRNFDSPIINYGEGRAVLNPFLNALEGEVRSRIVGSLLLLSTYDDGTVYSCMGRNALSMIRKVPSLPPPDLPRTLDLTHHLAFQTAVGFTRKEIDSLDDAFSRLAVHDARRIVDMLDAGYARRSSFGDRLNVAGKHQCPRHPLDSPFFQEEDPLAALDTTGGLEGVMAFPITMDAICDILLVYSYHREYLIALSHDSDTNQVVRNGARLQDWGPQGSSETPATSRQPGLRNRYPAVGQTAVSSKTRSALTVQVPNSTLVRKAAHKTPSHLPKQHTKPIPIYNKPNQDAIREMKRHWKRTRFRRANTPGQQGWQLADDVQIRDIDLPGIQEPVAVLDENNQLLVVAFPKGLTKKSADMLLHHIITLAQATNVRRLVPMAELVVVWTATSSKRVISLE